MLTILHIEADGAQSLRQAKWVSYDPKAKKLTAGMCVMGQNNEDGTQHDTFGNGDVYVMNDNGKTVATYDLER